MVFTLRCVSVVGEVVLTHTEECQCSGRNGVHTEECQCSGGRWYLKD